jgi:hypothetical protein
LKYSFCIPKISNQSSRKKKELYVTFCNLSYKQSNLIISTDQRTLRETTVGFYSLFIAVLSPQESLRGSGEIIGGQPTVFIIVCVPEHSCVLSPPYSGRKMLGSQRILSIRNTVYSVVSG